METVLRTSRAFQGLLAALALAVAACTQTPASSATAGRWQLMREIKLATFSASDPGEYDLMIFCDQPDHVRVYHLAPADAVGLAANLILRSDGERLELAGQREEERASPPPIASDTGPPLGVRVHARVARNAPVMRAFLRTGMLEATSGAHVTRVNANRTERDMLAAFFDTNCE